MTDSILLDVCPLCLKGPVVQRHRSTMLGLRTKSWLVCRACGSILEAVRDKYRYNAISKRYPDMTYLMQYVFYSLDELRQLAKERAEEVARQERLAAEKQAEWEKLLTEARAIVSQQERATPFQLQRGLRISYAEAVRLMDQLEDEGVVGPYDTGREWREVLIQADQESAPADEESKERPAEGIERPSPVPREQAGDLHEQLQRNLRGIELEKAGRVDEAIELYEENVKENFEGDLPYDRLGWIYRRKGLIAEEIRVLEKAIWVFEDVVHEGRGDRLPKLWRFRERLAKAKGIERPASASWEREAYGSIYDRRGSPPRRDPSTAPDDSKNPYILKWWTPAHDQLLARLIEKEEWAWADGILDEIFAMTPKNVIAAWKAEDPLCSKRAWYNVLHFFAISRAERLGLTKAIREPQWKVCPLCNHRFIEDSLPGPLVKRLGIDQLDFCAPCLKTTALPQTGNSSLPREDILAYLRNLTDVLQRVPCQGFGEGVDDLRDLSTQERLAVLKLLQRKPSVQRVKELFGTWFEALIGAGVLEDDARRMSRGTQCLARDGHICFSLGEKTIDDTLYALGIPHEKEVSYPEASFRADFVAKNFFIEYFGLTGDDDYDAKTKLKQTICRKHGIKLISVYPSDLASSKKLKSKLTKGISL